MSAKDILLQDRLIQAILYVQCSMTDLKKHGYIEGELPFEVTEKGMEGYKLLKDTGFAPTQEEVNQVMTALMDKRTYE